MEVTSVYYRYIRGTHVSRREYFFERCCGNMGVHIPQYWGGLESALIQKSSLFEYAHLKQYIVQLLDFIFPSKSDEFHGFCENLIGSSGFDTDMGYDFYGLEKPDDLLIRGTMIPSRDLELHIFDDIDGSISLYENLYNIANIETRNIFFIPPGGTSPVLMTQ